MNDLARLYLMTGAKPDARVSFYGKPVATNEDAAEALAYMQADEMRRHEDRMSLLRDLRSAGVREDRIARIVQSTFAR